MTQENIIKSIRKGEIDCNNQSLFFRTLIKGLLSNLRNTIYIRKETVPHFILHTGDEQMIAEMKGYNHSVEPLENTNEDYIYTTCPRSAVTPKGINIVSDQITSPHADGLFQYEDGENIFMLRSEFRRIPIKMDFDLQYVVNSYTDYLELVQQLITKLVFINTFEINYMGQVIQCSYTMPDSMDGEYMLDFDNNTTDDMRKKLDISIEVETNIPVFNALTVSSTDNCIMTTVNTVEPVC